MCGTSFKVNMDTLYLQQGFPVCVLNTVLYDSFLLFLFLSG